MKTLKFKTTVKCSGCVERITPYLDNAVGKGKWDVDIQNPDKILTVEPDQAIEPGLVIQAIQEAGYKGEKVE